MVVLKWPVLEDRDEWQPRGLLAQEAVVVNGQGPMVANGAAGCSEHGWRRYRVLGTGPSELANSGLVADHRVDVGGRAGLPTAEQAQLGEPARVQRPPGLSSG
jgi:hypothetical protein